MEELSRRDVLRAGGVAVTLGSLGSPVLAVSHAVKASEEIKLQVSKKPNVKSLLTRTKPEVYSGSELRYIGMPVGGLFAGTVYLGGDGQLWNWDIFNQGQFGCVERSSTLFMGDRLDAGSGANYVDPVRQQSPFNQAFSLIVHEKADRTVRFADVRFRGEYPVGKVTYRKADADVEMDLEAFSPFCPLDAENSSFPATTQTYTIRNVGSSPLSLTLKYETQNPVLIHRRNMRADFELHGDKTSTGGLNFSASPKLNGKDVRPERLLEDWSSGTYDGWIATGTAFGDRPYKVSELPGYMGNVLAGTAYVVNTHNIRQGENVEGGDAHTGTLTSPKFKIDRHIINLRVGGGSHKGETCINLIVAGAIVRTVTGASSNEMQWKHWDVRDLEGQEAQIQVLDLFTGSWGNISLGEVILADSPRGQEPIETSADFGTFCVEIVGGSNFGEASAQAGTCGRTFTLAPGEQTDLTMVVAWNFPNCFKGLPGSKNWYAQRWPNAAAVAADLIARWPMLQQVTRDWNRTWYDSTLPHWFLDRTFINLSTLATTTCNRLDGGRYYFWEGVGCCAGTCTHVWGYAQAIGRVFPEIERYLRKEIDFGLAFHEDSGAIDYRAEFGRAVAVDGQASCIMRALREHQMSANSEFLKAIWPRVKKATEYLIHHDADHDGLLVDGQYNTLDTTWYGEIAWISSLYLGALRAAEAMAREMDDVPFAELCKQIAEKGRERIVDELFNGEYFENKGFESRPEANNSRQGCHIDQLYGQSWAHQIGLPRLVPERPAKTALKALFKHNFYSDVWAYRRKSHAIPGGRWYATPQESGLVMCTFPKGGAEDAAGKGGDAWAIGYFNECMSGFEYQVASHMIAEGLVGEGLSILLAIHNRYHPSKRNPYNEVECSDHYGRAMASYGSFVTLTGFSVNGPRGKMAFHPKGLGTAYRLPFINHLGWGTYEKTASGHETVTYAFKTSTHLD